MQQILLRQVIVAFLITYRNFSVCNNFSLAFARHIGHFNFLYIVKSQAIYKALHIFLTNSHWQLACVAGDWKQCVQERTGACLPLVRPNFLRPLLPLSACYAGYNVQGSQCSYCIYCIKLEFILIFTDWHAFCVSLLGNLKLTIIQVPVKQSY